MRNIRPALLGALLLAGCATSQTAQSPATPAQPAPAAKPRAEAMRYGGGDGSSCEQAVIVHAPSETAGVAAEYAWLGAKYPGYRRGMQALTRCGEKPADRLHVRLPDGRELDVVFDISEYFGRF